MERSFNKKRGQLHLIIGPMFAGKTTELIRRIRRYEVGGYKCLLLKSNIDDRYSSDRLISHNRDVMPAIKTAKLLEVKDLTGAYNVIGIDEAQFFSDIKQFCEELIEDGKIVIVAGLDATFMRTPFEQVLSLITIAHSVEKLQAVCMSCGNSASFSKRVGSEVEIIVVGGLEKYMAVCRECYKLNSPPKSSLFNKIYNTNLPECDLMKETLQWRINTKSKEEFSTENQESIS